MDGNIVTERDGQIVYRASALGSCTRALVAARLGYEQLSPPEKTQKLFDRGHAVEEEILNQLRKDDWYIYDEEQEVKLQLTSKIAVVGHIDAKGALYQDSELTTVRVVESKSQTDAAWRQFETHGWDEGFFPRYKWQVSCYIIGTGLEGMLVRYNVDTGEFHVSFVDKPFYTLEDIRRRVLSIEAQAASGELPDACDHLDFPCPFYYTHIDDRPELDDPAVESLAQEYKRALRDEKAAAGRKKTTFTALKDAVGDTLKLVTVNGWKVTFYWAKNRPGIAKDKATPEERAIIEKYETQTESLRVKITEPENDGTTEPAGTGANTRGIEGVGEGSTREDGGGT